MTSILLKTGRAGERLPKKIGLSVHDASTDVNGAEHETRNGESPPYRLVEEIMALSLAKSWGEAKREWVLSHVFYAASPGTCLCGKYPIIEHCVICNRENGNTAVVGNHCVRRFMGLPSERIFAGLRRIASDRGARLGDAVVEYAYAKGWISDWEYEFCRDKRRGRRLSPRQRAKRVEINEKVLERARTQAAGEEEGCHA
jgi:hypothetical protein